MIAVLFTIGMLVLGGAAAVDTLRKDLDVGSDDSEQTDDASAPERERIEPPE